MQFPVWWVLAFVLTAALSPASAQTTSGDPKAAERARTQGELSKDASRKTDDFAEAARLLNGPAANPECVWLGRRVVNLLWRDDLDTAFRHLDLYDRFGCPGGHIQATFRCVIRQGGQIDPKAPDTLNSRVHACWTNPAMPPPQPAAAATNPAQPGTAAQ